MRRPAVLVLLFAGLVAARSWVEEANSDPKIAHLENPLANAPDAAVAGAKLYERYCSACHGKNGEGVGRNPGVHGPNVRNASPGALFWLLRNGRLATGMPSWSQLPPEQRWQIVSWLTGPNRPRTPSNRE